MEILFLFFALIAEIAGTISGFWSSSILLPIAHQFFDYQNALILIAIYHIFGNTSRLLLTYQHWDRNIFFLFGIPSIIATIIGASLVTYIEPAILKIILGCILVIFAIYSLWRPMFRMQPTRMMWQIGGALSGFSAGLIGTGGVLRGAFLTLFGLSRERYIATIASIALLVDFTRIPLYFGQGFLSREFFIYIPILLVMAFVWSYLGKKIVQYIPTERLRKIILISIMMISISLIWQWYTTIWV